MTTPVPTDLTPQFLVGGQRRGDRLALRIRPVLLPHGEIKGDMTHTSQPIRILSIEDHPVFREGLSAIIGSQADMTLVAQAADAKSGLLEFRQERPDVTLLDLRLPDSDGLSLLATMRSIRPDARVIVLTTSESDADILRALKAGAAAYTLKSTPRDEILGTIRAVHSRGKSICPPLQHDWRIKWVKSN